MRRRIAVIGAGAAGLSAAYRLQATCEVTLFEREARFGGHAWTWQVTEGPDAGLPLDVAFMVANKHNYPNLYQILAELNRIKLGPSEMSFSYCCRESGEEYAINYDRASSGAGVTETAGRWTLRPSTLRSLYSEIARFCTMAARDVAAADLGDEDLGTYLELRGFSDSLRRRYIIPMGAALWSAPPGQILNFSAALFLRFMDNHGLLNLSCGRSWQHVLGGCRVYVHAIHGALIKNGARLRPCSAVVSLARRDGEVAVKTATGDAERFDAAVIATHADQALGLLADPSAEESALLGCFDYQNNDAVLHCDENVMPGNRGS